MVRRVKLPNLNQVILTLLILQVIFFRWISLELQDVINILLVGLILLALVRCRNILRLKCTLFLILFFCYQIINFVVLGGSVNYLLRNWFRTFKSLIIIFYITNLLKINPKAITGILEKWWIWFNLYALVNIPILLQQRRYNFSLTTLASFLGKISYKSSSYYSKDMMSGLFGLYGTPCLAAFITFLILYNYVDIRQGKRKRYKIAIANNICISIFYFWMATQNDNKGFYIMFFLFACTLLVCFYEGEILTLIQRNNVIKKRINNVMKLGIVFATICGISVVAYISLDNFRAIVDLAILKIREGFLAAEYSSYTSVDGGGERFAMILYALSSLDSGLVGFGLGNYVYTAGNLGFAHFGQADVGTFICLGGSIYILLMFGFIFQCFKRNFKNAFVTIILTLVFFVLSCYTHVLMDTSITVSMMLTYVVCWLAYNNCEYGAKK